MVTYFFLPPLGHDQMIYSPLANHLKGETLIFIDYPYFDKEFNWHSEALIDDLAHKFSKEILAKAKSDIILVGVSLGATLALKLKEILGDRVTRLNLIATGGLKVASFRKQMILAHINSMSEKDFLKKSLEIGVIESFENSEFKKHFFNDVDAASYWDHFHKNLWNTKDTRAILPLMKASLEIDFEKLLSKFQDEITIIWGENDKVFSMRFFEKFQKICPNATFHLLKNVGHFLPLETPEKLANILKG